MPWARKLTDRDYDAIRAASRAGVSQYRLAAAYSVGQSMISAICSGEPGDPSWRKRYRDDPEYRAKMNAASLIRVRRFRAKKKAPEGALCEKQRRRSRHV